MHYHHSGNQPVYAHSYGGPKADAQRYRDPNWFVEAAEIMRTAYEAQAGAAGLARRVARGVRTPAPALRRAGFFRHC